MRRQAAVFLLILSAVGGCKSAPSDGGTRNSANVAIVPAAPATQPDRVIAKVNGRPITLQQLEAPLIESYGLNVLLNLVQLELAREQGNRAGVSITDADVTREREVTLEKMFKDAPKEDYDSLLEKFLAQQRISRPEFDIVMRTNAYLRKIAEPMLAGKISEQNLKDAFAAIYGETIVVQDIQVSNLQEIAEARRRLAAGETFARVAQEMSRDSRTAPLGGELPPFSRAMEGLAQSFKDAAFALKEGEISDPVEAGGAFHLIRLSKRNAPRAVKYEDMKESVRAELQDRWVTATMKDLRAQLAQSGMQTLEIEDSVLKKQFDKRMGKAEAEAKSREQIERDRDRERQKIRAQQEFHDPATRTTTRPATGRSAEPPATRPGH